MSATFSLQGKRVLVTSANTGIGQGICLGIGRASGAVVGVGRSAMEETAEAMAAVAIQPPAPPATHPSMG